MSLEPLSFPTRHDDWVTYVTGKPAARLAEADDLDNQLKAGSDLSASERIALWDEAVRLYTDAATEPYLLAYAHPDAAIRDAAEETVQKVEAQATARGLDRDLYDALAAIDPDALDRDEQRILERALRDFRRSGVDRDEATRERLRALADRDSELSIEFSRNIRDGKREIRVAADRLAGLPDDFLASHPADEEGLVTLTTEYPDLMPVREYATDRELRTELVATYGDLAWPENDTVLSELLSVRAERAELLGYGDWADYETETRMIGSSSAIRTFLDDLDVASRAAADQEYDRLLTRLRQDAPDADAVLISDYWYLLGALKRDDYSVDAQEVRGYFPFERVLPGVLEVTGRLLGLTYQESPETTWHEDVRSYDVLRDGDRIGRIHLDLHPREGKYNHAACFGMITGVAGKFLPEGTLLCNFSRGLMEHDEVVTFFHEFGHLVHLILGGAHARFASLSGLETEWDFVEAPSQLLEEWAWDPDVLAGFTADAEGNPIPRDLVERMRVADAFGRALEVRRQLGHAQTSYHLHVDRPADLLEATEHWYSVTSPVRPLRGSHTYAGFGHLTGYGACYYTYQWSLVIARDLLSAFDGDLMNPTVAARYRQEILERGASRDAGDMVESFLGRPYSFDSYRAWLAGE